MEKKNPQARPTVPSCLGSWHWTEPRFIHWANTRLAQLWECTWEGITKTGFNKYNMKCILGNFFFSWQHFLFKICLSVYGTCSQRITGRTLDPKFPPSVVDDSTSAFSLLVVESLFRDRTMSWFFLSSNTQKMIWKWLQALYLCTSPLFKKQNKENRYIRTKSFPKQLDQC